MQPYARGRVELTKDIFDFSTTQDLRVRAGCDAIVSQAGNETILQLVGCLATLATLSDISTYLSHEVDTPLHALASLHSTRKQCSALRR